MARGVKFGHCLMVNTPDHREGWDMRRLFGTDETYYAVIFIPLLIVNGGFALFGFEKLAGHIFR